MKTWVEFTKKFEMLYMSNKLGEKTKIQGGNDSQFMSNIKKAISECKMFNIDNYTKQLLMLTKPPKSNEHIHLPFDSVFVSANFTQAECEQFGYKVEGDIEGFIIEEGVLRTNVNMELEVGKTVRIIACIRIGEYIEFNTFNIDMKVDDEWKDSNVELVKPINKKAKKFLHQFVLNLINLINDPEIELIYRDVNEERNIKRAKKGKIHIPSSTSIRLDAKRKIYLNQLMSGESFTYGHSFWVRGFWRNLKSPRFKEKKRIWIMPFIKGKGILIEKEYDVHKEEL